MTAKMSCQENSTGGEDGPLIRLVAFNARYTHSCLALFYLREELVRHIPEVSVELLQLTINDNDYESLLRIADDDPFAVFFSGAIWNSEKVCRVAADLHRALPRCQIVVGGPEAGVLRRRMPAATCSVVEGEIEAVEPVFYTDLLAARLRPVYEGRFLRLEVKELYSPYRDEDFSGPLHNRHIYYESSRGCPYGCTYCLSATERGVFHKPLAQVERELGQILHHRPAVVRFIDRTFNDLPDRALAIWRFLLAQDTETLFHFEIAPERFTEEMFEFLKAVPHGRMQFEIGIQSTNGETLEAIRRKVDIGGVRPIIERLAQLSAIHLHVDLILGLPHETEETFARSFREVFAMGAHYIQMGLLKILPDTPLCHGAEEYGYVHSETPPYAVLANRWLNHRQLAHLYWFCETVEKFHNNRYFVSLWHYLRHRQEDVFSLFMELLAIGRKAALFERAATQELLGDLLVHWCRNRSDQELILDLLRYDWLRCGHRRLPASLELGGGRETPEESRDLLYQRLPVEWDGLYDRVSRNRFFKRTTFWRIGAAGATALGLADTGRGLRLAVLQERERGIHGHNRTLVLEEAGG